MRKAEWRVLSCLLDMLYGEVEREVEEALVQIEHM
jgi:hypothetical protein